MRIQLYNPVDKLSLYFSWQRAPNRTFQSEIIIWSVAESVKDSRGLSGSWKLQHVLRAHHMSYLISSEYRARIWG